MGRPSQQSSGSYPRRLADGLWVLGNSYFNLYLDVIGLSSLEIGVISALMPLCGVVVPTIGGLIADRLGRPGETKAQQAAARQWVSNRVRTLRAAITGL